MSGKTTASNKANILTSSSPIIHMLNGTPTIEREVASNEDVKKTFSIKPSPSNEIIKTYLPIQTPRSELGEPLALTHSVSSTIFKFDALPMFFEPKPLLSEVQGETLRKLFVVKCQQLCQVLDFTSADKQFEEKAAKDMMLMDLLHAVSNQKTMSILTEKEYSSLYQCFFQNNIRTTPNPPDIWSAPVSMDFMMDKVEEVGWSHLSMMYDIMTAFLSNPKFRSHYCQDTITPLIRSVILMFQSPDQREREKLTTLFYAIYKAFRNQRNEARDMVAMYFNQIIASGEPVICCHELLIVFASIFPGYKVPLHPDHITFFNVSLLPLHRCSNLYTFHNALVSAVTAMLSKDSNLTPLVFNEIIKYWPFTSPPKQIMLLKELELLTDFIAKEDEKKIVVQFSKLIANCVSDANFAVAERTLLFWESDSVMRITKANAAVIFPIVLPMLYKTTVSHWCGDVRSLARRAMGVLKGINKTIFEKIGQEIRTKENDKILKELKKGCTWNNLIDANYKDKNARLIAKKTLGTIFIGCESLSAGKQGPLTISKL